jgi:hypothetical protein
MPAERSVWYRISIPAVAAGTAAVKDRRQGQRGAAISPEIIFDIDTPSAALATVLAKASSAPATAAFGGIGTRFCDHAEFRVCAGPETVATAAHVDLSFDQHSAPREDDERARPHDAKYGICSEVQIRRHHDSSSSRLRTKRRAYRRNVSAELVGELAVIRVVAVEAFES